jgi:hypothetical protein
VPRCQQRNNSRLRRSSRPPLDRVDPVIYRFQSERQKPGRAGGVDIASGLANVSTGVPRIPGCVAAVRFPGTASRSRRVCARVLLETSCPLTPEGVGNAGCPPHPQPRVVKHTSVVTTSPPEHPAFPHAMVLTAYFVLSPVIGLSCHRRLADMVLSKPGRADLPPLDLTPASRRQDHTILPSAKSAVRQRAIDRSQAHEDPPCHHVTRPTLPRPPHPAPRP